MLKALRTFQWAPRSILATGTVPSEPSREVTLLGLSQIINHPPDLFLGGLHCWTENLAQNFPGNSVPSAESHLEALPHDPETYSCPFPEGRGIVGPDRACRSGSHH